MRRKIIAGNWKMNMSIEAAKALASELASRLASSKADVEVVICPTFLSLDSVARSVRDTGIGVGAQDCYHEDEGAFTGEVNPKLLKDAGASYCIIGHSERRGILGETDKAVNLKAKALIRQGLTPIVCVGETIGEKKAEDTLHVVSGQAIMAFAGISSKDVGRSVIAYEPVWAIGTGLNATSEDAQAVCRAVRNAICYSFGPEAAENVRIQYGGSVKADNIDGFMMQPDIDGALVGGASLKPGDFERIVLSAARHQRI